MMTDNPQPSIERICRKCGETKSFEDFAMVYAKNSRGQNYRQYTCKICAKAIHAERMRRNRTKSPEIYLKIQREHRIRHLERVRRQRRESGRRRKLRVLNQYGGAICVCCDETCLSMLTMDHIENNGSVHRKEDLKAKTDLYCWLQDHGFPKGFQVLCYNCNISKHRCGGVCEHKLDEGSETRAQARSLEAIAKRSSGRRSKAAKI